MASFHGLEAVEVRSPDGARAVITLQGAQVMSWTLASGQEQLFVSERTPFTNGHPVRGGIPVVFPQFSKRGPLPQHGFARVRPWRMVSNEPGRAVLALEDSGQTRELWPHAFALELHVSIGGERLEVEFRVRNSGDAPFQFTTALHTYFRVSDAMKVAFEGLPDVRDLEKGLDRVYPEAPPETRIIDATRVVTIGQRGFRDTVVWNPGRERTSTMTDMAPLGFMEMLCVEAATVEVPIVLLPGASWSGVQSVTISRN